MELGPLARARGFRLVALGEIDSTNDEAGRLIAAGERGPLWITAAQQTKGRGRLGRNWVSEPGNLYASLVLSGFGEQRIAPQLGFAAGVAAVEALRALTGAGERLALKWPNDVLLDGAKLAGVLLECVSPPTGDPRAPYAPVAIIGIGVNCLHAPEGLPYEARALSSLGAEAPSASAVFSKLTDSFVDTLDLWRGGAGFALLRRRWLDYAAGLGGAVRVALTHETIDGRFETIDEQGRLVVVTNAGRRTIEAGDVFFARAGASQPEGTRP